MAAMFITGSWEGALLSDQNGHSVPFSLQQSAFSLATATPSAANGMHVQIGSHSPAPAQLLDAASRSIVALVDASDASDANDGLPDDARGQWLMDARLRGNQLVGHWVRRDPHGHILGTGQLSAAKIVTRANSE